MSLFEEGASLFTLDEIPNAERHPEIKYYDYDDYLLKSETKHIYSTNLIPLFLEELLDVSTDIIALPPKNNHMSRVWDDLQLSLGQGVPRNFPLLNRPSRILLPLDQQNGTPNPRQPVNNIIPTIHTLRNRNDSLPGIPFRPIAFNNLTAIRVDVKIASPILDGGVHEIFGGSRGGDPGFLELLEDFGEGGGRGSRCSAQGDDAGDAFGVCESHSQ